MLRERVLMLTLFKPKYLSSSFSVEFLHFFTGASLVLCGGITYLTEGLIMMLSWTIFGAMYISMSDIGEDEMKPTKLSSKRHRTRVIFAYLGALLSILLLIHTISSYISI